MSNTLAEPTISTPTPDDAPGGNRRAWRVRLKRLALAVVCLWLADLGISLLIQHTALKRRLTARLEAVFGRPVDVRSYRFTLWTGPALEATSVTVGEDPRFGNEYFLHAESVTLRLRWRSLLSGNFDLGTISLSRPSLNLVRTAEGDWNLAEWLPRPSASGHPGTAPVSRSPHSGLRFHKIDVDGGRINFKRADEKLPFAFVGVTGTLETENPGLWRLDLIAVPSRAAVIVQQPGVLHLVGHVGGTSSRLRPAAFEISWNSASLTDVSRLALNRDYGIRGDFDMSITGRTQGDSWLFRGNANFARLHRWDLALRSDNPSMDVTANGVLDATGSHLELSQARIEAPHSNARVAGALDWTVPGRDAPGTHLQVVSEGLALADLLAWTRAFHASVADGIAADGYAQADLTLGGWPPRLQRASVSLPRAEVTDSRLRVPVHVGSLLAHYDTNKGLVLSPTAVTLGTPANSFRIDGSAKPGASAFSLHVQGSTTQARDVAAAANQLGWNLARGWDVAGPARCDLRWQGTAWPLRTSLLGTVEWGTPAAGASLHAQFLNLPVEQLRGRADLKPGVTHFTLASAQAFGTHWTGTFDHDLSDGWKFAVSGDSLFVADVDRWLNPRWRESFLDRLLPFLSSRTPASGATGGVRARGRLMLAQFGLAPVVVHGLSGDLTLDGRHLEFSNASGQFYHGQLVGSLTVDLEATPKYEAKIDISGVDIQSLTREFPSLDGVFQGSASAKMLFGLRGPSRADLLDSLECRGTALLNDVSAKGFTFAQTADADSPETAPDPFPDASATFACGDGTIQFQDLLLLGSKKEWKGVGSVDYAHKLDLRFQMVDPVPPEPRPAKLTAEPSEEYRVTGTIGSPKIARVTHRAPSAAAVPDVSNPNDKP